MHYLLDVTIGHDCSLQELKQGLITADVRGVGTLKHLDHTGKEYVFVDVMKYGFMRFYPSTRITKDRSLAETNRKEILATYK